MADRDRLTLHRQILQIIEERTDNTKLQEAIAQLARQNGPAVYAELIHILASVEVQPHEAEVLWEAVCQHTVRLSAHFERPLSIVVALHDYITTVKPYLHRAKVIDVMHYERMAQAVIRDSLTGVYNAGYIREQISWEVQKGKRYGTGGAILLFDLDSFKQCNDQYGHLAGDAVLRAFALCLLQQTRGTDVVGRYGGEEFVALLPSTNRSDALVVAERIRLAFEATSTQAPSGPPDGIRVTTSGGITEYGGDDRTPEQLIELADQAQYLAKRDGKNRVYLDLMLRDAVLPVASNLIQSARPVESSSTAPLKEIGCHRFLVTVTSPMMADQLIDLDLALPVSGEMITLCGQVISTEPGRDGASQAVIRVVERQPLDWLSVDRFLCQEEILQQRQAKRPPTARHR